MAQKLRKAEKEIQILKAEHEDEMFKTEVKLDEANLHISKLKSTNKNLSKKLLQAIEVIRMSCFSYELNHDGRDNLIKQLQYENRTLRVLVRIQDKFDCKDEVEEVLKSEELIVRNKEAFLRSRSMQMRNHAAFSFSKKEDDEYFRRGKRSSGKVA